MDQILTNCNGVIENADDVDVHGKDDKEHNNISTNSWFTYEHGLDFNKDNCAVKHISIVFFQCFYDANGADPDPEKVSPQDASTETAI